MESNAVLRVDELDAEIAQLLPPRETLWSVNVANVIGVNISLAINAASINASASALAAHQLYVLQH